MLVLSAHVGLGSCSFLLIGDDGSVSLYNYPYSYDELNFSHFCSPQKFYRELFNLISGRYEFDLKDTKVLIVSSLPEKYFSDIGVAHFCPSSQLDLRREDASVVYLKRNPGNEIESKKGICESDQNDPSVYGCTDILSNMCLYKNLIPASLEENVLWGYRVLSSQFFPSLKSQTARNILFTGPALTGSILSEFFKYSLAFSTLDGQGLFSVSLDDRDLLYNAKIIQDFEPEMYSKIAPKISFGTAGRLLKCSGKVECLIKKEFSTESSLFEVNSEDLFVYPLAEGEKMHVFAKGNECQSLEFIVEGGELGFVVDTRTEKFWQVHQSGLLEKYKILTRKLNSFLGAKQR